VISPDSVQPERSEAESRAATVQPEPLGYARDWRSEAESRAALRLRASPYAQGERGLGRPLRLRASPYAQGERGLGRPLDFGLDKLALRSA